MKNRTRPWLWAILALALAAAPQAKAVDLGLNEVDLQLAVVIDVSGSITDTEYGFLIDGYVQAFASSAIADAIGAGDSGAIAVSVIFFSGQTSGAQTTTFTPWQIVSGTGFTYDNAITAADFSAQFENDYQCSGFSCSGERPDGFGVYTNIAAAIDEAVDAFAALPVGEYDGRQVIDISGDGPQNCTTLNGGTCTTDPSGTTGYDTYTNLIDSERDAAESLGITINGITIEPVGVGDDVDCVDLSGDPLSCEQYYKDFVRTSDGFVLSAVGFEGAFAEALQEKLVREIQPPAEIPEPAPIALIAAGLAGLGFARRRRRNT